MTERLQPGQALLAGLLGPAGEELTCERYFEHLDVYVEHELTGADADRLIDGMRAHLQGCPACREEHDSLRDLLEALGGN